MNNEEVQQQPTETMHGTSAGAMLRSAREAQGMHIAAIAVALKVPVNKLQMLEDDKLTNPSDMAFIRALAGSVCRTLKIDPQPVLAALPKTTGESLPRTTSNLNEPFSEHQGTTIRPRKKISISKPVLFGVGALALATLAVIFVPSDLGRRIMSKSQIGHAPAATANTEAADTKVETVTSSATLPASAAASTPPTLATVPTTAPAAPAITAAPIATPAAAASAAPVVAAATPPAPAAELTVTAPAEAASSAPADSVLFLQGKGEAWVSVVDAHGKRVYGEILKDGQAVNVKGDLPLRVSIGRKSDVIVSVHGKPFDINSLSKSTQARFKVE